MIKQLQGVFSAYPNISVGRVGDIFIVLTTNQSIVCEFLMNEGGIYDVWFSNTHGCLSQGMVRVVHDALVLLNSEVIYE